MYRICLTGHRPNDLKQFIVGNAYDYGNAYWISVFNSFVQLLEARLQEFGAIEAHSGMALGADTVWAGAITHVKKKYPDRVVFIADVPLPGQASKWPKASQITWQRLVNQADRIDYTTQGEYYPAVMEQRNRQMIDPSDECVAFWSGKQYGGTYNGVQDAINAGCKITVLRPQDFS